MKRLLLPLLAALALPTFAGDLGSADFNEAVNGSVVSEKNDRSQDFGITLCGWAELVIDCDVRFNNGRLTVDGSKGITPDQIVYFDNSYETFKFKLHIFYKDSQGIINQAIISKRHNRKRDLKRWHRFMKEFMYFINQENKTIPSDYF